MANRSFRALASICGASLWTGTVLLTACSGKQPSGGANDPTSAASQAVSVSDVTGTVTPCPEAYAHPNVCCDQGAGRTTSCVDHPGAPFAQCAEGLALYPDPRSCCPLDNSGNCIAPPAVPPDGGSVTGGGGCFLPCPVGWYTPPNATGGDGTTVTAVCCSATPNGEICTGMGPGIGTTGGPVTGSGGVTTLVAAGGGPVTGSGDGTTLVAAGGGPVTGAVGGPVSTGVCSCPACPADGPCPACDCVPGPLPPPPAAPVCNPCPAGWQSSADNPFVCCSQQPDGIACFSQGLPPTLPALSDAGVGRVVGN